MRTTVISILLLFITIGCGEEPKIAPYQFYQLQHQGVSPHNNYPEQIQKLRERIHIDSLTINQMEKDYVEQWEENQIFSSMLSEIENEPGGHEIIEKIWNQIKSKK